MASDLQHCSACREEYVAGVAACVECGGPLQPGPLDRLAERAAHGQRHGSGGRRRRRRCDRIAASSSCPACKPTTRCARFLLEGITCGVECEGVTQVYAPGQPPAQPFAVTLPVTVYVADAQYEAAQEILASLQHDDMIGDQWSDASLEVEGGAVVEDDATAEPAVDASRRSATKTCRPTHPHPKARRCARSC